MSYHSNVGELVLHWRYNHDPENGNIRNLRELRKFKKIKEIQENQGNSKNLVNKANSSNSEFQYNLKLQLFKLCWNSRKSRVKVRVPRNCYERSSH
jgi:hypothetical protein